MSWRQAGVDSRAVALIVRGKEVPLTDGRYVIGRGTDCDVMVDDPRASRRHASLHVFGRNVTILDLKSGNGTKRNGQRLPEGPQVLLHGDIIGVGHEEMRLLIAASRTSESSPFHDAPAEGTDEVRDAALDPDRIEDSWVSTRQSEGVQMVLVVGEKALEEGKSEEAEAIVRPYLANLMNGAVAQRAGAPGAYAEATAFALQLARTTGKGEWFDYAVEMLRLRKVPCTAELARQLRDVVPAVGVVELRYLEDYARALRGDTLDVDSYQRTQWLDELVREVRSKTRPSVDPAAPHRGRATIPEIDLRGKLPLPPDKE